MGYTFSHPNRLPKEPINNARAASILKTQPDLRTVPASVYLNSIQQSLINFSTRISHRLLRSSASHYSGLDSAVPPTYVASYPITTNTIRPVRAKADCRRENFSEIDVLHFCKSVSATAPKNLQYSKTLPTS